MPTLSTLCITEKIDSVVDTFSTCSHGSKKEMVKILELVLVANSDAGKLNARNVFYCYVNVSVRLIINDDSVGDLIYK